MICGQVSICTLPRGKTKFLKWWKNEDQKSFGWQLFAHRGRLFRMLTTRRSCSTTTKASSDGAVLHKAGMVPDGEGGWIRIPCILYVDDVLLLADTSDQLQAALNIAWQWAREIRMRWNAGQTKSAIMFWRRGGGGFGGRGPDRSRTIPTL